MIRRLARLLLISFGLIAAGLTSLNAVAQQPDGSPEALLSRIQSAARALSFSGTFVHQQDSTLHTSRITQIIDAKQSVTKVQALEGHHQEIIKTPNETRIYLPERQVVKIDQTSYTRAAFPAVFVGAPEQILKNYEVVQGGSMRVADIDAVEVFFKPRHESRWPVRAWIDKKTSLVVKCQKLDAQGAVLEQVAFTQFSLTTKTNGANPGGGANSTGAPTTGGLTSSFVGVKDWKVRDASMVALAPAPSLKYKPETLKGFEIVGVYQRAAKTDQAPFSIRRYVLSDGIATVSVFVQSRSVAGPLTERVRRNGALTMLSREIQEAWVTVMGDVPPETLRQFAQTIEWKSTP